jgi:DnaJ-class molecular chaperone
MEYRDYYATLGVPRTASEAEIKRAFRKLARKHHPDVNKQDTAAERRFKEVNEANAVLSDPEKRKAYDEMGANWEAYQRAGAAASRGGAGPFAGTSGYGPGNVRFEFHGDPEDLAGFSEFFRTFFAGGEGFDTGEGFTTTRRGQGTTRTTARSRRSAAGGRLGGLEDLFGSFRGDADNGEQATGRSQARAHDLEAEAEISLEEAFHGTTRLVEVDGRRLEVKIPRGVATGQRIRLSGKAGRGADAGDLYVRVRVREHPVFKRTGADLQRELPITLAEALLGAEVPVETLKGRVLLRVPPETQTGRTFRLAGQGMPHFRGDGQGDLYVRVRVVLPTGLDEEAGELVRRLDERIRQPDPRTGRRSESSEARRR